MPVTTTTTIAEATALLRAAPSPIVVVPVRDSFDDVVRCLEAVGAHTSPEHAILVVDDAGADRRFADVLKQSGASIRHTVVVLRHAHNVGFVRSCNEAFAVTAGRDVVLLNSDVVVGPEWVERLTAAALSDDTIATATTLTNHGTIVSVPHRNRSVNMLPRGMSPDEAATRVAMGSHRSRPTIPTAVGHCFYIRREALDLVGWFDERFSPGYGEEVDFCQRAVAHGFRHVCADDVFTFHRGAGSFGTSRSMLALRQEHDAIVRQRYRWYEPWVARAQHDPSSTLADALSAARRSVLGLTVGVDALCLGSDQMGTQRIVVGTIRELARRKEISRLVAFVPIRAASYVDDLRAELSTVEFVPVNPVLGAPDRVVDVLYRPYQVSQLAELDFLHRAGERFVVNQLDAIAFGNPAYFGTDQEWVTYRDLTRLTLELAHGVAFLSDRSRAAAAAERLLDEHTPWAVVSCGIRLPDDDVDEVRPLTMGPDDTRFLLCIGASYLHKNRPFALQVWAEMRRRGWAGRLVLAGPTPPHGNSLAAEAELLLGQPHLRPHLVTLGSITEAEKRWLYRRAALVLYPSVVEGFGMVPYEAADHGVPTLAPRRSGLAETLPPGIPVLNGFDVRSAADQAWRLVTDQQASADLVGALQAHACYYEWKRTGDRLLELFKQALRQPRGGVLVREGEGRLPVGLASRAQREAIGRGASNLERLVHAVVSRPRLKQGLSPDGSRRQRVARVVIAGGRSHLILRATGNAASSTRATSKL